MLWPHARPLWYQLWVWTPKRCPCCRRIATTVQWHRRRTSYQDESSNWAWTCRPCADEDDAHIQDLLDELHADMAFACLNFTHPRTYQ